MSSKWTECAGPRVIRCPLRSILDDRVGPNIKDLMEEHNSLGVTKLLTSLQDMGIRINHEVKWGYCN